MALFAAKTRRPVIARTVRALRWDAGAARGLYSCRMAGKRFFRVSALIHATEREANALQGQLQRLLCPDPDHTPPCPIPWETTVEPVEDRADTESLRRQVEAEP